MKINGLRLTVIALLVALISSSVTSSESVVRPPRSEVDAPPDQSALAWPYLTGRIHDNGLLWTTINNNGVIGNIFRLEMPNENKTAPTFYHPMYSRIQHGYWAGLWVGGVVAGDTLVSVAMDADW